MKSKKATTHFSFQEPNIGLVGFLDTLIDGRTVMEIGRGVIDKTGEWHTGLAVETHAKVIQTIDGQDVYGYVPISFIRRRGLKIVKR